MCDGHHLTIDLHTHVLPKTWPDLVERYGYEGFIHLEHHEPGRAKMMRGSNCFRIIDDNCWSAERRIEECDRAGVDVQVLSTVPVMFSYWARPKDCLDLSRYLNDHIAEMVARYPKRFVGLGTLPMQDPDLAIRELERAVGELGLAGVQIGSHINGWNLDQPELFPVFERCAQLGASVFVHPWEMLGEERMAKYWLKWLVGMPAETTLAICSVIFGGVLERLPQLRIAFAHGGGSFPFTLGRIQHGFDVRPDLCATDNPIEPSRYLSRIYVDSLVHDEQALRFLIEQMGVERIALGSDYPFPLGEIPAASLIRGMSELDDRAQRRLLAGTALEFLGLAREQFIRERKGSKVLLG